MLKPGEKIVQAWQATGWWPNHYSIAVLAFEKVPAGTRLTFTQIEIPPHRYSGTLPGWIEAYWTYDGGDLIGAVSSGGYSHTLAVLLAHAYPPVDLAEPGTKLAFGPRRASPGGSHPRVPI